MVTTFLVPIRVRNGSNDRCHWAIKAKRAKSERAATVAAAGGEPVPLPCTVTMTRIYTRQRMDRDGNVTSLKHVQDAVADLLGIDDGDEDKVSWRYAQRKGDSYGVEVVIESAVSS